MTPPLSASTPRDDSDAELQETLDSERSALESAARANPAGTRSWLLSSSSSSSPEDTARAAELYEALEKRVSTPWFLETVERALALARARATGKKSGSSSSGGDESITKRSNTDVTRPEWWSPPTGVEGGGGEDDDDAPAPASSSSPPSHLDGDESPYVLVSRDDVVDAVAHFVASYVASLPQSRDLSPAELRSALATTLRELGRRGKAKMIWSWGKWLYRAAALSYGAFGAYTNPWLARAVLAALWTSAKVMVATVVG